MRERYRPSRFAVGLAIIVAAAYALLVAGAYWYDRHVPLAGDANWYAGVARYLAHGQGFFDVERSRAAHHLVASASHPPLFPAFLAVPQVLGFHGSLALRLWSAVGGAATVLLVGLIGRDLAGERAGLLAAVFAALFIDVAGQSLAGWSEGAYACTIVLTVYAAYRFIASPDVPHAVFLGIAITLATLVRAEAVLLYAILLVPLAWRARDRARVRRVALVGAALGVAALLVAPWVAYNRGRFRHPVLISTGLGALIASANCPPTYSGPFIGDWGFMCQPSVHVTADSDETVDDVHFRAAGIRYARDHAGRLPVVVAARLGRTFGFYRPSLMTGNDLEISNTDASWLTGVALGEYYLFLALGIAGFVILVRRRVPVLPFLAVTTLAVFLTVFGYGTMRFRIALEAVLPVLAAVAIDAALRRRRPGQRVITSAPLYADDRSVLEEI